MAAKTYFLEYMGESIQLSPGETLIGRGLDCMVRLNDPAVSRQHLRLRLGAEVLQAEDLGSTNGTTVNGKRISAPRPLEHGDRITLGSRTLHVRALAEAEDQTAGSEEETLDWGKNWMAGRQEDRTTPPHGVPTIVEPAEADLQAIDHQNCPSCRTPLPLEARVCSTCHTRILTGGPLASTQVLKLAQLRQQERRIHERIPVDLLVLYMSSTLVLNALARNLSHGGMFIATDILDEIGTPCNITLLPEGKTAIHVTGVVRRVVKSEVGVGGDPPGMGIEFATSNERLESFMAALIGN